MTGTSRGYRDLSDYDSEHIPFYDHSDAVWRVHVSADQAHLVVVPNLDGTLSIDRGDERLTLRISEARQLLAALGAAVGQVDARGQLNNQQLARLMSQTDSTFR